MNNSKRQIALSSVLAMLLYLVPNLVQDIHRIWGHEEHQFKIHNLSGHQFVSQSEKCPVCIFEFNVTEDIQHFVFVPLLQSNAVLFIEKQQNQTQKKTFCYYNLRAPPQA